MFARRPSVLHKEKNPRNHFASKTALYCPQPEGAVLTAMRSSNLKHLKNPSRMSQVKVGMVQPLRDWSVRTRARCF